MTSHNTVAPYHICVLAVTSGVCLENNKTDYYYYSACKMARHQFNNI